MELVNRFIRNYLKKNMESILDIDSFLAGIPDETICKVFDKVRDSVVEARHLKNEVLALKAENDRLRKT